MSLRTSMSASIAPVLTGLLLAASMQSTAHAEGYVSVDDCSSIRAAVINSADTYFLMSKANADVTLAALNAARGAAREGRSTDQDMMAAIQTMSDASDHFDASRSLALADILNRVCPMD